MGWWRSPGEEVSADGGSRERSFEVNSRGILDCTHALAQYDVGLKLSGFFLS